jgi:hypothetical protein
MRIAGVITSFDEAADCGVICAEGREFQTLIRGANLRSAGIPRIVGTRVLFEIGSHNGLTAAVGLESLP